jgi:hypothetical protein
MVLVVERREPAPAPDPRDPGPRSVERALSHMHWHYTPADASPLMQRLQERAAATSARIFEITPA